MGHKIIVMWGTDCTDIHTDSFPKPGTHLESNKSIPGFIV